MKYHCLWASHLTSPEACSSGRRLLPCSRGTGLDVFCGFSFYLLLFSCSVMSNSLWPHELQHTRLPCPSPPPGVCSNSCPLSQWCHPPISFSVVPVSSFPQSFPASGSFPMGWLFTSDGQSIRASASASVPPMNIQDWFPLGLTSLISLLSKGLSRVFSSTTVPPLVCLISVSRQLSGEIGVRVRIRVRVRVGVRLKVRVSHLPIAVQLTGDRARIWTQGAWLKALCS